MILIRPLLDNIYNTTYRCSPKFTDATTFKCRSLQWHGRNTMCYYLPCSNNGEGTIRPTQESPLPSESSILLSSSSVVIRFVFAPFIAAFCGGILQTNAGTQPLALLLYTAEVSTHTVDCKYESRTCSVKFCALFGQLNWVSTDYARTTHGRRTYYVRGTCSEWQLDFKKNHEGSVLYASVRTGHARHPNWGWIGS